MGDYIDIDNIQIDETTYYSILGITSEATEVDIRKSYMRLAKKLHPDKSKSETTGEVFKVIVNAHSILTDNEKRNIYDNQLKVRSLYDYIPHDKSTDKIRYKAHSKSSNPKPKTRHSRPYEEQPYGFGFGSDSKGHQRDNKSKVPIFQSFNLKTYQRNLNQKHKLEEETESKKKFRQPMEQYIESLESDDEMGQPNDEDKFTNEQHIEETLKEAELNVDAPVEVENLGYTNNNKYTRDENEEEAEEEEEEEGEESDDTRPSKISRNDTNEYDNKIDSSTYWNHDLRRSARNRFESREQVRRSISPIKNVRSTIENDINNSFSGLNELIDKLNETEKRPPIDKNPVAVNINNLSLNEEDNNKSNKRRNEENTAANVGDNDYSFNMRNINDTLDSIPMSKRAKLSTDFLESIFNDNIHEPVNYTLPRFYKKESIALGNNNNFGIDYDELNNLNLPEVPKYDITKDISLYQLEIFKQEIVIFNQRCHQLKDALLKIYSNRIQYDAINNEKLLKVENFKYLNEGSTFNLNLMNKMRKIEELQYAISQYFINLSCQIYNNIPGAQSERNNTP